MPLPTRPLGSTGLLVTPLCAGGAPLGGLPAQFGYDVSEARAVATLRAVFAGPINFLDTSNGYADGRSERRIGIALRQLGGLPPGFVLATKVDPAPGQAAFDGRRVRASVHESLERLGLDRLPLVYLHDPERISWQAAMAPDGPVAALKALQAEGVIGHLGVAGGPTGLLQRFLDTGDFAVVITHNRWTLVNSSARGLIARAAAAGYGVINAAPYGGGMLAKGPRVQPKYCYQDASPATVARVAAMEEACAQSGVPLAAAALQFSTREPLVVSTIVGISSPERVGQLVALQEWPIPPQLWRELDDLAAVEDACLPN